MDLTEDFGDFLRRARREKGYSQVGFSKAVGASQQSVSRWERGEVPPLATLARISTVLGIPLETLAQYERPSIPTLADRVREQDELIDLMAEKLLELEKRLERKRPTAGRKTGNG